MDAGSEIRDSIVNGENCKIFVCWFLVERCRRFGGFQCLEIYSPHPSHKPKPISQFSQFSLPRGTQPKPQPQTLTVFIVFTTGSQPTLQGPSHKPKQLKNLHDFHCGTQPTHKQINFLYLHKGSAHPKHMPKPFPQFSKFSLRLGYIAHTPATSPNNYTIFTILTKRTLPTS